MLIIFTVIHILPGLADESAINLQLSSCVSLQSFELVTSVYGPRSRFSKPVIELLPRCIYFLTLHLEDYEGRQKENDRLRDISRFAVVNFKKLESMTIRLGARVQSPDNPRLPKISLLRRKVREAMPEMRKAKILTVESVGLLLKEV